MKDIHSKSPNVKVSYGNIAPFESGYWNYDLSQPFPIKQPIFLIRG